MACTDEYETTILRMSVEMITFGNISRIPTFRNEIVYFSGLTYAASFTSKSDDFVLVLLSLNMK